MAEEPKEGRTGLWFAVLGILCAAAAGGAVWLSAEAAAGEEALERAKLDYRDMVKWRPAVEDYRKKQGGAGGRPSEGDTMTFLSRKATASKIPPNLFSVQRNPPLKTGGWSEESFTVTLRGNKEEPVRRDAVVDFIRLVETERPSVKVKNLQLAFAGDPLATAVITFSTFEPAGASAPK